jgi:hypothetical protein
MFTGIQQYTLHETVPLFNDLLSLKADVTVLTVSNEQKKIFVGIFKATDEKSRIQIRSRIPDP